jgi:hypothetical protein
MVSMQEEGRERCVLFPRHPFVCEQDWGRLTEVRPAGLVDWGFSRYVVCGCEGGWMNVYFGTRVEAWERFRR